MERHALENLSRPELIRRAGALGVERAEVMTRVELVDEIVRRVVTDADARRRARGWLGVARDLVAGLIEQGFHLPEAAALVRRAALAPGQARHQPPVATVTLAEIYATQGHVKRARAMLAEVLAKEPDHQVARTLHDRLTGAPAESLPEPEIADDEDEPEVEVEVDAPPPESSAARATEEPLPVATPAPAPPLAPPEETVEPVAPAPQVIEPARDVAALSRAQPDRVRLYWEVRARHFLRGPVVLRVVSFVPARTGAERFERDVTVDRGVGVATVEVASAAVVCAAVGVLVEEGFVAVAVAVELQSASSAASPALERAVAQLSSEPG